jgi:succinylglutamate desuccinylase
MMEGRGLDGHATDQYGDLARLFAEEDEKLDEDGTIRSSTQRADNQQDSGYGVENISFHLDLETISTNTRIRLQGGSPSLHAVFM